MQIHSLKLGNFRSIQDIHIDFDDPDFVSSLPRGGNQLNDFFKGLRLGVNQLSDIQVAGPESHETTVDLDDVKSHNNDTAGFVEIGATVFNLDYMSLEGEPITDSTDLGKKFDMRIDFDSNGGSGHFTNHWVNDPGGNRYRALKSRQSPEQVSLGDYSIPIGYITNLQVGKLKKELGIDRQ